MLKRLIVWVFGCWRGCQWETLKRIPVYSTDDARDDRIPVYFDYELRCTKCGEIKRTRT